MIKKASLLLLFFLSFLSIHHISWSCMPSEEQKGCPYRSPNINVDDVFQRKESSAYLKCREVKEAPNLGFGNFSFSIIAKKDTPFEGKEVGRISARYSQKASAYCSLERAIEIGSLEIDSNYRKKGYGEAAIRTILGIFRSPSRNHLLFNRFWLTVGLGPDRIAARALYSKVGFTIETVLQDISYQNMTIAR